MSTPSRKPTRRAFVRQLGAVGSMTAAVAAPASGQPAGRIRGFDHVALPMRNVEAMLTFYKALGASVRETPSIVSVLVGEQMINFHRPALWQDAKFTLRAPAAAPPCGDLCFVWEGTPASIKDLLDKVEAKIIEGPVPRQGGRQLPGSSVYVRDPDGNLLEFLIYG